MVNNRPGRVNGSLGPLERSLKRGSARVPARSIKEVGDDDRHHPPYLLYYRLLKTDDEYMSHDAGDVPSQGENGERILGSR